MVARELVQALIKEYSPVGFASVIKAACAPSTFVSVTGKAVKEKDLPAVNILGVVKDLPGEANLAAPLLVADIPLGEKPLTERSSRIQQFKVARKALEKVCMQPPVPVAGIIVQGVFAFHDKLGNFRVSLVTATAENGILKWSSAKRQSFYVEQGGVNATFVQRMTMDWSSLTAIKEAFSVERLTKQFYNEIQNWYFWAQLEEQHVSFPNDIDDDKDDAKYNGENLIRLITRMVFTWFLKEKKLVNPQLFDTAFLKTALVKFDSEATVDDLSSPTLERNCSYYRAILQNLFFATFNQEIKRRQFVDDSVLDKRRRGVKNYFRNAKLFAEDDPKKILAYFNASPFVNGGLFECLDDIAQKDKNTGREKVYRWDGFSNNLREHGKLKSAIIPNRLFFCDETTCDLSSVLEGKSAKSVKVRGLIRILESYNFTIEENSPSDEEVALDPELLGKVFENLLGCFNPETQKMARNSTGSFYTPREEVNYMVGESLVAYLKRALTEIPESEIRDLVAGGADLEKLPTVKANVKPVLAVLFRMKLLDPACGSGAFPMGAMLTVVEMLRTLDPDNKLWRKVVIEESKKAIADITDEKEHAAILADIEQSFDEKMRYPDYARKLYVIEHCIFGSDIQPIAVQISRLRFFISLLCEQRKTDVAADNYGVTPLPNLENNFVAANSLLSIDLSDMRELLKRKTIATLVRELRETRHRLFLPKTAQQKADLKEKDRNLCDKIDAAAVAAYAEHAAGRIAYFEKELAAILSKRSAMSPAELAAPVSDVSLTQGELFGDDEKQMSGLLTKGEQIQEKIRKIEKQISDISNSDRKRVLLDNIRRLVHWNPFAFNIAEEFLDPEWMFGVKDGFDIVIGNPPYGLINKRQNKGLSIIVDDDVFEAYKNDPAYLPAQNRGINIYRLFVLKSVYLLSHGGIFCEIFPLAYAGDLSASPLRSFVFENYNTLLFDAFPERDDERKRVFEAVKMSVCILTMANEKSDSTFEVRIHSDKDLSVKCKSVMLSPDLIRSIDPANMTIPLVSQQEMNTLARICQNAKPLKTYARCATGELDMTFAKSVFTHDVNNPTMHRGAAIGRYLIHEQMSQGEKLYVDEAKLKVLRPKLIVRKKLERVALQGITGVNELIRLKATLIKDAYCANSVNYIENKLAHLSNRYLLGLINSKLLNFYFTKFSTNSNVNGYEIDNLPIYRGSADEQENISKLVSDVLSAKEANSLANTSKLEQEIDEIVYDLYGLTAEERAIVEKSCEKPEKAVNTIGEGVGSGAAGGRALPVKAAKVKKAKTPTFDEEF